MANPRPPVKKVLCSALVYTALAGLHRTNSPATRLQQPVPACNKSTQRMRHAPRDHGAAVTIRPAATAVDAVEVISLLL
jgi:hypothetical protein